MVFPFLVKSQSGSSSRPQSSTSTALTLAPSASLLGPENKRDSDERESKKRFQAWLHESMLLEEMRRLLGWSKAQSTLEFDRQFAADARRVNEICEQMSIAFSNLFTKRFEFKITLRRKQSSAVSGGVFGGRLKAKMSAQPGGGVSLSTGWTGLGQYPACKGEKNDDQVLDVLELREIVNTWKEAFSRPPWGNMIVNTYVKSREKIGAVGGVMGGAASFDKQIEEYLDWSLKVESYSSEEVMSFLPKGASKDQWHRVNRLCDVITDLIKLSKSESQWTFLRRKLDAPLVAPLQFVLVGEAGVGKSSIARAIQVTDVGFKPPSELRVRPPLGEGGNTGTEGTHKFFLKCTSTPDSCEIVDVGSNSEGEGAYSEPHQFVVLVMETSRVFDKTGAILPKFQEDLEKKEIPYLDVAHFVLLTKWDALLYDTPVTNEWDLTQRLDEMWTDYSNLRWIQNCCDVLAQKLRSLNPDLQIFVRSFATLIFAAPTRLPNFNVYDMHSRTIRMIEDLLEDYAYGRYVSILRSAGITYHGGLEL